MVNFGGIAVGALLVLLAAGLTQTVLSNQDPLSFLLVIVMAGAGLIILAFSLNHGEFWTDAPTGYRRR